MFSILFLVFVSIGSQAQKASVDEIPTDTESNTVISISKQKGGASSDREFEIVNGSGDIAGDQSPLSRGAKDSWKKACDEWKAEIKDLNKENMVLAINCGQPNCKKEAHGSSCSSVGTYQLKVRMKK